MSHFSILPAHLTVIETWIVRFFVRPSPSIHPKSSPLLTLPINQLLLTILTIGPWALFLAYDLLLYALRTIHYEIPVIGGRATGARRPAKPTLEQRPDGRRRVMSITFGDAAGMEVDGREGVRRRRKEGEGEGLDGSRGDEAVGE